VSSLGLAELVLIVDDVPASARFYEGVVGLAPENEPSDDWAWFWAGQEGVPQRVALHRGPLLFEEHSPYPEGERFGRVHFAFGVARDELDTAVERVRKAGVEVHGPIEFEWMQAKSYYSSLAAALPARRWLHPPLDARGQATPRADFRPRRRRATLSGHLCAGLGDYAGEVRATPLLRRPV
jgi:catechol 2,3-dioxygenase-like lactoylglutathione lyase family enzyme